MALTHGLDFAIFYACLLALFSYLLFFFVPIAVRVVYATARSLVQRDAQHARRAYWFDGHHSQ